MGLIRANQAPAAAQVFSMKDIEQQARSVLLRAQQQAEQLLAAAAAEGEQLRLKARQEGLDAGRRDGLTRGREQGLKEGREQALTEHRERLSSLGEALGSAMQDLQQSRVQLHAGAVDDVVRLAIAIAHRVTHRLGERDPQVVRENVEAALRIVGRASDVRIMVNPTQLALMEEALPGLRSSWADLTHIELVPDESVLPGGCRIATGGGLVDADLQTQLDRIVAELLPDQEAV